MIEEASHGGVMNVKNPTPFLPCSIPPLSILDGDAGVKLSVTQPLVRLEPGQEQQVRFILETDRPLTVEHYKRVIFEGIPPKPTIRR